jgi:hypothetical protein
MHDCKCPNPLAGARSFQFSPDAEWRTVLPRDGVGVFCSLSLDRLPLKNPSTGRMHRRLRYASRNVGSVEMVSHLALIGLRPPVGSLHGAPDLKD